MCAKLRRLVGFLGALGLALMIAAPPWTASASHEYDDFRRLIEILYDDGLRIVHTHDDAGNRLTQVTTVDAPPLSVDHAVAVRPDAVVQGSRVTYSATVTNHGPDAARGAIFTATLPRAFDGLTLASR